MVVINVVVVEVVVGVVASVVVVGIVLVSGFEDVVVINRVVVDIAVGVVPSVAESGAAGLVVLEPVVDLVEEFTSPPPFGNRLLQFSTSQHWRAHAIL